MQTREQTEGLILELAAALDAAIDDGLAARAVDDALHRFLSGLQLAILENDGDPVELEMDSSVFVHDGDRLTQATINGLRSVEVLRACEAGGYRFGPSTSVNEVRDLLRFSVETRGRFMRHFEATEALQELGIRNVSLIEPSDDVQWMPIDKGPAVEIYNKAGFDLRIAAPMYRSMAVTVEDALRRANDGESVDLTAAWSVGEQLGHMVEARFDDLLQLVERPDFDVYTVRHTMRVSLMAAYVGSWLGAPPEILTELGAAGLMHDVGKGRIPDEILTKPGRLDDDELRLMRKHPVLGAEILLESQEASAAALGAAWGHHLRHDGTGYPDVPKWAKIGRITSLIQVCDVFEALTARRSYKAPYSPARAYKILYGDKGAFDPVALAAFTRAMGLYPPGRFVRLSDGRLARVARVGRDLARPLVKLLPSGEPLDLGERVNAGLSVAMLVEEPVALQELMGGDRLQVDREVLERTQMESHEAESDAQLLVNEQVAEEERGDAPPPSCTHGDDCRLC